MWSAEATAIMRRIVSASNCDILVYNAPIERHRDRRIMQLLSKRTCKSNLLLILVTNGGDPDVAYRIARTIQNHYTKFTVCVPGICKSAGTLLLLGANEIAFTENGEIGPLDIQMAKKDDLWESESGLTVMTALTALSENAQDAFDHFLISLTTGSGGRITVRTASEIAAKLTQALYAPITDQIDPIHMGEVKRAMSIAREYASRLIRNSKVCDVERLDTLISAYPSHSFVIDRDEAKQLFKPDTVRDCTPDEMALVDDLDDYALIPSSRPWVKFISDDIAEEDQANAQREASARVLEQSGTAEASATTGERLSPKGQNGDAAVAG